MPRGSIVDRMSKLGWVSLVALAGCRLHFEDLPDAPLGAWSTPVPLPNASSPTVHEENSTVSSTKTELFFTIASTGVLPDLYVMRRASPDDAWGPPEPIVELNTTSADSEPRLSPDDLTLYFSSNRPGTLGGRDVWVTTRTAIGQPWAAAQRLDEVSTSATDKWLSPCADGSYLMVRDVAGAGAEILEGVLGAGPPTAVAALNTPGYDNCIYLAPDCLTAYFASDRSGLVDLYVAHRPDVASPWEPPVPMVELNTPDNEEEDPWMSPDGRLFVFSRLAPGGTYDLYSTTR